MGLCTPALRRFFTVPPAECRRVMLAACWGVAGHPISVSRHSPITGPVPAMGLCIPALHRFSTVPPAECRGVTLAACREVAGYPISVSRHSPIAGPVPVMGLCIPALRRFSTVPPAECRGATLAACREVAGHPISVSQHNPNIGPLPAFGTGQCRPAVRLRRRAGNGISACRDRPDTHPACCAAWVATVKATNVGSSEVWETPFR